MTQYKSNDQPYKMLTILKNVSLDIGPYDFAAHGKNLLLCSQKVHDQ